MSLNNDAQKSHLQRVENTLSNLSNTTELSNTINKTTLDLFSTLGGGRNLYIDDDIRRDINGVNTRLQVGQLDNEIANELVTLGNDEANINAAMAANPATSAGYATRIAEIGRQRTELNRVQTRIAARRAEYTAIQANANNFNVTNPVPNQTADITAAPPRAPLLGLNLIFAPAAPVPTYQLCDQNGTPLSPGTAPNTYTIQVGGQAAILSGIQINAAQQIDLQHISISPATIDISQAINLSISASYNNVGGTGINVSHNKPFSLQLSRGPAAIPMDTVALRNAQIDAYNNSIVTNPGVINRSLDAKYNNELIKLEKEAVFAALKKLDGPKFEKLNDAQKDELFNNLRATYSNPATSPTAIIALVPTPWHQYITDINSYNSMRDRMSADDHESNTPEHTKSEEAYRNYVHNHLEEQTGKYISAKLGGLFADNLDVNMYLKAELSNFFTNIENRKMDNDTHSDIDAGLQDDAMENYRRYGVTGRRDVNYLRLYEGHNTKTVNGTVKINTEREALLSGKKYPDPLTYGIDVAVKKNSIDASIKIPGIGDIPLKGREPNAIVREILRRKDIPFGKLRMSIAYSFFKAMVQMTNEMHINLDYTDPGTGNKRRIRIDNGKLVIEQYDDHTNHSTAGAYRRLETIDFNEEMFENTQERDSGTDNRSLRRGIEFLATEFNCAMNQVHRGYRTATEKRRFGLKKGEMRTTLPTNFFLSPIKSMRKWFGEKMDFPFTTSASAGGKTANIEFTGKTFKITMGEKTYTNNNLGTILNTREHGARIFDGIEREICAVVYKKLIEEIRGNKRVANKHFGVVDPMTKGVYMIDADGDRSYIEPENARQSNIQRSKFMERTVGATFGAAAGAGAGVGTAALVGGSLIKGGLIGTSVGALTGGFLGSIDSRNSYGEIPHPPSTRNKLTDAQQEQLYRNPLLMARIIRAMSDGLR